MNLSFSQCHYRYRSRRTSVLENFSYELESGLTILLGPNGAGKSTLLKLAAGLLNPDRGSITLGDLSSTTRAYRKRMAWMPQHIAPVPGLTTREYVAYLGWLKGMRKAHAWEQSLAALGNVDLLEQGNQKVTQLSGGQLRRAGLASALVHDAEVVLLDEPTAGLDPRQRRVFRDVLSEVAARVPVLMSTHDVADLARESDRVTVVDAGTVRWHGGPTDFLALAPGMPESEAAEAAYLAVLDGTPAGRTGR
ncbi:ATP-binding cassette domain-containing protein [Streptomyces sp. NPDC056002]|uniref:ATP-binding cassette domain-containing protein n=1 Tax=Streptomyces sp. NPDC056002 TaxID=3345675 RepID=UPI0035D9F38A